jgi:diguanylate cyclase (GGDEF)-like protein
VAEAEKKELEKRIEELERELKETEKDLIHDSLTSLKTRAFFEDETTVYLDAIAGVNGGKRREWFGFKHISFLFFDIDYFKKINDTYGHGVGDIVLREVAGTIAGSLREGDTAARWGGEEIVVSLLGADEEDAKTKAEEIRKLVSNLTFNESPDLSVSVSVGVASAQQGENCHDLIGRADKALYKAKEGGRNQVVAYSELIK